MNIYTIIAIIVSTTCVIMILAQFILFIKSLIEKKYREEQKAAQEEADKIAETTDNFDKDEYKFIFGDAASLKYEEELATRKEEIKKKILEKVIEEEKKKKEKLQKNALLKIIKDVLADFRQEFYRKARLIIEHQKTAESKKKKVSIIESNRDNRKERKKNQEKEKQKEKEESRQREDKENQRQYELKKETETQQKLEKEQREKEQREKEEKSQKERQEQQAKQTAQIARAKAKSVGR